MRKILLSLFIMMMTGILLTACSGSGDDAPAKAVEANHNALVAKEENRLPTLVCGDCEQDALIELDSFQAVTPRLDNAVCKQTGTDGDTALVSCTGKIIATYNNEDQEMDLSVRTYQVVQDNGDWLVCGTR